MGWNKKNPAMIFGMIVLGIGFVFGLIWVVMALWNWLMPAIFDINEITYWQAAGLLLLSKILFGGFCHKKKCGGHHHTGGHWKHKFKHKWASMSDEDKRKWEEKFGKKCGFSSSESHASTESSAEEQ